MGVCEGLLEFWRYCELEEKIEVVREDLGREGEPEELGRTGVSALLTEVGSVPECVNGTALIALRISSFEIVLGALHQTCPCYALPVVCGWTRTLAL